MNAVRFRPIGCVFTLVLLMVAIPSSAATLTWDASGNGSAFDGTGNWSSTGSQWWNGASDQPWDNSGLATAVFGAASGTNSYTVNVDSNLNVAGLTFAAQNYVLGNGGYTITLAAGA